MVHRVSLMERTARCGLEAAAARRRVVLAVPLTVAARALHAMLVGLIHDWLLASSDFDLLTDGTVTTLRNPSGSSAHSKGRNSPPGTSRHLS